MKQSWGTGDGGGCTALHRNGCSGPIWQRRGGGACRWGHCETPARLSVLYVNGRR